MDEANSAVAVTTALSTAVTTASIDDNSSTRGYNECQMTHELREYEKKFTIREAMS